MPSVARPNTVSPTPTPTGGVNILVNRNQAAVEDPDTVQERDDLTSNQVLGVLNRFEVRLYWLNPHSGLWEVELDCELCDLASCQIRVVAVLDDPGIQPDPPMSHQLMMQQIVRSETGACLLWPVRWADQIGSALARSAIRWLHPPPIVRPERSRWRAPDRRNGGCRQYKAFRSRVGRL